MPALPLHLDARARGHGRSPWLRPGVLLGCGYGLLAAVLVNLRLGNDVEGIAVVLVVVHVLVQAKSIMGGILDTTGDYPPLAAQVAAAARAVGAMLVIAAIGTGIFALRVLNTVRWVDTHRPAISAAIASGSLDLPGVIFSQVLKGGMDIEPCRDSDVVVYVDGDDYWVVVPITRPEILSFTSFPVLMWDHERGWWADRIHWHLDMVK
jgi:hypothetical protein